MMGIVVTDNSTFACPAGESPTTVEAWQFKTLRPNERSSDAPDFLKTAVQHRHSIRLWRLESLLDGATIEPLFGGRKTVIQAVRGRLPLIASGKRTTCGGSSATPSDINLAQADRQ